jgi:nucleotide-binding universal stress UspA family protein
MNDDWRLQVDPRDPSHAQALSERLQARELEHDLSNAFHDRVIVSRDGDQVFLYAGTREQAESARELLLSLAQQHGWELDIELKRWHPIAEDWEDPDKPLPVDDGAEEAEHEALIATERKQAEERGYPEFEVRVDLPSHHDALHLVERLRGEGLLPVHRWKYVLIGATDEDNAKALAKRIEDEAPPGSKVSVEGTWQAAYDERPPNPFAFLGGLGG